MEEVLCKLDSGYRKDMETTNVPINPNKPRILLKTCRGHRPQQHNGSAIHARRVQQALAEEVQRACPNTDLDDEDLDEKLWVRRVRYCSVGSGDTYADTANQVAKAYGQTTPEEEVA